MLLINKGQTNSLVVTVSENVTLPAPVFLLRFVCDLTNKEYAFILPNVSTHQNRFDEFIFIEGTTGLLESTGFYHYYIYEQSSAVNIDYKLSGACLEVGKLLVVDGSNKEPVVAYDKEDKYKTYE